MIATEHSGMPDGQIIRQLLNPGTIFLTTDRPLHNTVLSRSLTSYYVSHDGHFISAKLKGIRTLPQNPRCASVLPENHLYHAPPPNIRAYLLPLSERSLKKLRTKRRRIRNHFDGDAHIETLAVTVSWKAIGSKTLIGLRLRITSNSGIPALDASELYVLENILPVHRNQVAVNYALMLPIQLMLHGITTRIYYDAPTMASPTEIFHQSEITPGFKLFTELSRVFSHVEFCPSVKGRFIEPLRKKLMQLVAANSNEIVEGNIEEIERNVFKTRK
ncbi:MAG: hypothetical protein JXR76_07905 [Deltaproteobacteria bacterium]|nr:hypothetical protein [Deltaproteobacteria bacterium]